MTTSEGIELWKILHGKTCLKPLEFELYNALNKRFTAEAQIAGGVECQFGTWIPISEAPEDVRGLVLATVELKASVNGFPSFSRSYFEGWKCGVNTMCDDGIRVLQSGEYFFWTPLPKIYYDNE